MTYARRAVKAVGKEHWHGLARAVGVMDLAITDALGLMDSSGIARDDWRGAAVGALIRQNAVLSLQRPLALRGTTLSFVERPNIGLRLVTPSGECIRIRALPRDLATGAPLSVTEPPELQESLLGSEGPDLASAFEYGLFWTIDDRRGGVGRVFLAAADFTKTPNPAIYALVGLDTRGTLTAVVDSEPPFTDNVNSMDNDDYGWEKDLDVGEGDEGGHPA